MAPQIIMDNEYVTLTYHPEKKIVHHQFHQTVHGKVFREVLNAGLAVFEQHHSHKWLSDDRKNSALPADDTAWAQTDWFPRVVNAGWKYWALVMPPEITAQMNLQEFVDTYSAYGLRVMVFNDPDKAMIWLERRESEDVYIQSPSV